MIVGAFRFCEIEKNLRQKQGLCLEKWHSEGRGISKYGSVQRLVDGKKTRRSIGSEYQGL